jgi:hypothetical protein
VAALKTDLAPFPPPSQGKTRDTVARSPKVLAEWWINAVKMQRLVKWVQELDSDITWVSWTGTTARFMITEKGTLAEVFRKVHAQKEPLKMVEYSLAPTTLEQIFHTFAAKDAQDDPEEKLAAEDAPMEVHAIKLRDLDNLLHAVQANRTPPVVNVDV